MPKRANTTLAACPTLAIEALPVDHSVVPDETKRGVRRECKCYLNLPKDTILQIYLYTLILVQARNLNKEDAMDCDRWRKLIKIG